MSMYSQEARMGYRVQAAHHSKVPGHHEAYKSKPALTCGIAQIILGVAMLAANIATICMRTGWFYVGHGIWTGILLIIAGSFTIPAAEKKKKCYIKTSLVMSILSALGCGAAAFMSVAGIDFNRHYYYYSAGNAVESIILVASLAAGVISIVVSSFTCKSYSKTSSCQPTPLQGIKTLADYPQCSSLTIGILQIVSGIGSVVLGIMAVCKWVSPQNWALHILVGIWCGSVFFAHGVLVCTSVGQKTVCKIRAQTVLAYVAGFFALIQLGFASFGIYTDVHYLYRSVYYNYYRAYEFPSQTEVDYTIARIVVTGMLLLFGLISVLCCFWGTIFGCRGLCKCCATPSLDKQIHFPAFTSKCFGTAQVVIGILSIGFGTASFTVHSFRIFIGVGIWCGAMYVIAGTFGYLAGVKKIKSLAVVAMVLSIICGLFAAVQLGISIAVIADSNNYSTICDHYQDDARQRCYDMASMYRNTQIAMYAMLLVLAVAEAVCLIITSAVACKACCNCFRKASISVPESLHQPLMTHQQPIVAQPPPSYVATTLPLAQGAVFMYQNGALVPVPVVLLPGTITATSQLPQSTGYPQMLGVVNPAVNPRHPGTEELRTTGEEKKDGPPNTPPPSYRSSSDLPSTTHNTSYE